MYMEEKQRRYVFEKYKNKATRLTCPKCGRQHCLTRYIDVTTGLPVHDSVGRCDHVQSCGYDLTPYQFYKDNPWERDKSNRGQSSTGNNFNQYMRMHQRTQYRNVSWNAVERFQDSPNSFTDWFGKLFESPQDAIKNAIGLYHLRTFVNERSGERGVIFWQIDQNNDVRDGKIMYYQRDGHRKQYMSWVSAEYRRWRLWNDDVETKKCFFGEHLLKFYSKSNVCLVESEKTAIICSTLFPQYIWLATCGCGQLKNETALVLRGRNVVVFPDTGEELKWRIVLETTGGINYSMVMDFEHCAKNTDVADLLLSGLVSVEKVGQIITNNFNQICQQ